ncbi:MAG: hypothetical protein M1820_000680 [Bogoriella megaspora]|nr:MAG: hypothetical protein M1820_000680 [Bogoriella megaspora]
MPFQYKIVLLIGATSGIGAAMADRLVHEGSKVIAVGRRQDRLDAFVKKHGQDKAAGIAFDITDRANTDSFAKKVTQQYPDLDCVFLNSAVQSPIDFTQSPKEATKNFLSEININFISTVEVAMAFLPFLQQKKSETSIIFTGTHLALAPATAMPAYSSSKAALNSFIMCLREQLQYAKSSVKVVEIWPPLVQTELHDYLGEERGRAMGMPVDQFTDEAYIALAAGREHIIVGTLAGTSKEAFDEISAQRDRVFDRVTKILRSVH